LACVVIFSLLAFVPRASVDAALLQGQSHKASVPVCLSAREEQSTQHRRLKFFVAWFCLPSKVQLATGDVSVQRGLRSSCAWRQSLFLPVPRCSPLLFAFGVAVRPGRRAAGDAASKSETEQTNKGAREQRAEQRRTQPPHTRQRRKNTTGEEERYMRARSYRSASRRGGVPAALPRSGVGRNQIQSNTLRCWPPLATGHKGETGKQTRTRMQTATYLCIACLWCPVLPSSCGVSVCDRERPFHSPPSVLLCSVCFEQTRPLHTSAHTSHALHSTHTHTLSSALLPSSPPLLLGCSSLVLWPHTAAMQRLRCSVHRC
jgi:hypothetical protein